MEVLYLGELAQRENVIALGCHVDYWDWRQWTDTFSQAFCSQRQKDYRTAMGTKHIYTPQMVINGQTGVNGTDVKAVEAAISETSTPPVKDIEIVRDRTDLTITLPQAEPASLYLMTYDESENVVVLAGTNNGRVVGNVHPVRTLRRLPPWDGTAQTITASIKEDAAGIAVIANRDTLGPVIAAGSAEK